jgi:hypothetical protein
MFGMSLTENMTASGVLISTVTLIVTVLLYRRDQTQQQAAQTREALQAIIGDCGRFLHPLTQEAPYPILYTAATITKEFCSHMGKSPTGKDVLALLQDEDILRSICVEGWIASTQFVHMMDMVEGLEHKAYSHYLRGKLLLICQASFLLAGIVAKGCSPTYFYTILSELKPLSCQDDEAEIILNRITVELQNEICQKFDEKFKKPIVLCLSFIQKASRSFMKLPDRKLVYLAKRPELHTQDSRETGPNSMIKGPVLEIEQEASLSYRFNQVKDALVCLKRDIDSAEYQVLDERIKLLEDACVITDLITHVP